jgi:fructose-1,6-bisphosphatase class 3
MSELKYLELLSKNFRNIAETSTEIINLEAILNLPKGTEHFLSDIHGEYEAFTHVLRNGSGSIRQKIEDIFGETLDEVEKKELATLIYYPEAKYNLEEKKNRNIEEWSKKNIYRLVKVCKHASTKYTRSKVRKAMPKDFEYIIQELLYERNEEENKRDYVDAIIDTIISIKYTKDFMKAMGELIRRLAIDRLHVVGDIYDRGPAPHLIMDCLQEYHNVDIQWGNHDLLWIGAGIGNKACIANVIRICSRYNNHDILEEAYGINLLPLATFAMKYYGKDPCRNFRPKEGVDNDLIAQMHKAISIIQFKVEGIFSERNPQFEMEDKELLKNIDYHKGTVTIGGKEYQLNDTHFPTVNPDNPLELTKEEVVLLNKLKNSFMNSEKLQRHLKFLLNKGSMYLKCNSNLLYHGCIPLDSEGELVEVNIDGISYKGKSYFDKIEAIIRESFFNRENNEKDKRNRDFVWYLWCGKNSPLFGKDIMRTFERYFIDDKKIHKENKNPYYAFINEKETCVMILREFGLNPENSHIINGHVPVKVKEGESPVKADGKLFMIDGGFSKAYRKTTGIAGYTLVYNSYGIKIISLAPFESQEKAIKEGADILSSTVVFDEIREITKVKDTDIGKELQKQIDDLKKLLISYKTGLIKQKEI